MRRARPWLNACLFAGFLGVMIGTIGLVVESWLTIVAGVILVAVCIWFGLVANRHLPDDARPGTAGGAPYNSSDNGSGGGGDSGG